MMNWHPSEVLARIEGADLMKGCEVKKASQVLLRGRDRQIGNGFTA